MVLLATDRLKKTRLPAFLHPLARVAVVLDAFLGFAGFLSVCTGGCKGNDGMNHSSEISRTYRRNRSNDAANMCIQRSCCCLVDRGSKRPPTLPTADALHKVAIWA